MKSEQSRMSRAALVNKLEALQARVQELEARRYEEDSLKIEAQERFLQAIEACPEGFAWYDAEDRLVAFNKKYQEIYAESADLIRVGASYEAIIRQGVQKGQYPGVAGQGEEWIENRLAQHRAGSGSFEQCLPGGRWIQVSERRLPDGGVVGIRADITKLKQAEEALRESEELFKGLFDLGLVGMAILLPSGEIHQVNKAYCDFVGYDEQELIGAHFSKVVHPDHLENVTTRMRQMLAGALESYQQERHCRHKEGYDIWGLADLFVLRDAAGDVRRFVVQVQDVSERKRAEEACRERETFLRQAADMARLGHWVWDEVEDRCIYCSETLARMNGVTVAEYYANYGTIDGLLEEVHPEDRERYLKVIQTAAEEKCPYSMDFRELRPDGSIRFLREQAEPVLNSRGRLVRTVGTLQDMTEIRQTEQALESARDDLEQKVLERTAELRTNQAHLKAIMDHVPMEICLKDTQGRYLLVNQEFENRYNVMNGAIIGEPPTAVFPEPLAAKISDHDEAVLKSKQTVERIVQSEIDGEVETFQALKFPVLDTDGNVTGIGVTVSDITERARAEEALQSRDARLRELKEQLERFSRVSALGQLSRSLAYNMSQPITAIMNYCAVAQRQLKAGSQLEPSKVLEVLDKAMGQAAQVRDNIRHSRGLFETAERTTSPQDINQIVEDALALAMIDPAQAGALYRFERGAGLPRLNVSRLEIEQVVFNLIKNALEAVTQSETGEVTIETKLNESGMVEVVIGDSGGGVSADVEARMFEPFVTTKPNAMGLGLSISQTIIEAYNGRLWLDPNPGGGTRAHVTLRNV